jgi:hypothetical protein
MIGFARDCGYFGLPFRWDPERRMVLRSELDAAMFHLYGITERKDVEYILDTFPIVRDADVRAFGDYRTKLLILDFWDAMGSAIRSGEHYVTRLDPPPVELTSATRVKKRAQR